MSKEDLIPKINGKTLMIKKDLPLETDLEFLKELRKVYDKQYKGGPASSKRPDFIIIDDLQESTKD